MILELVTRDEASPQPQRNGVVTDSKTLDVLEIPIFEDADWWNKLTAVESIASLFKLSTHEREQEGISAASLEMGAPIHRASLDRHARAIWMDKNSPCGLSRLFHDRPAKVPKLSRKVHCGGVSRLPRASIY